MREQISYPTSTTQQQWDHRQVLKFLSCRGFKKHHSVVVKKVSPGAKSQLCPLVSSFGHMTTFLFLYLHNGGYHVTPLMGLTM